MVWSAACTVQVQGEPDLEAGVMKPPSDQVQTVDLLSRFEIEPDVSEEYWRQRDFSGAQGMGLSGSGDAEEAPNDQATGLFALPTDGGPISAEAGVGLGEMSSAPEMPTTGLKSGTTGRLYTSWDSTGEMFYVCSASVVNSATHDVLATAGHCVWDTEGDGGVAPYLVFVPGDKNDAESQPFGRWTPVEIFLRDEFRDNAKSTDSRVKGGGWTYDYAFVRLAPNASGQKIQDVVGAQGIAFGIPAENLVAIGYPSAPPFDGRSERYCSSTEWERYVRGGYTIDCNMTAGASGGGWFTRWDPVRGAGYLVGVSSVADAYDSTLSSNAFGRSAYELYEYAGAVSDDLFQGSGPE
jgi:hypothetical protein